MASTSEIAKTFFAALAAQDLDAALACWAPGGIDRFVAQREMVAPDEVRAYFAGLFAAFPDFTFEVLETTTYRDRCAVRWRGRGTFAGPGRFEGLEPNNARLEVEGCSVLRALDERIVRGDVYFDSGAIARQLGVLPPLHSASQQRLTKLVNAGTRARQLLTGAEPEAIAAGVWVVRGGRPRTMNVYLIADEGGVTVFDAGIEEMAGAVAGAAARLGGIKRVVLGHADCDHRGSAPLLGAPVYCHPAEREAAESASPVRDYWRLEKLSSWARPLYPKLLRRWDGGAVTVAGSVVEGERVAGFRVVHLPGHAPGLIGLFREEDGLALVSDCLYTLNPETSLKGPARVPHVAFNQDTEQARAAIRKLAALQPAVVWSGHADPVTGDVAAQLERAAAA